MIRGILAASHGTRVGMRVGLCAIVACGSSPGQSAFGPRRAASAASVRVGSAQCTCWRTGLADEIDASVELLQGHQPYRESDHVMNIAYILPV